MTASATTRSTGPRVAVVIPVHDRAEYTVLCLQSIEEGQASLRTPFEVVLVDNASHDETPSVLAVLSGDVRTTRNEHELGRGEVRNQGAALSTAEHVLFLEQDTFVLGDWLDVLVDTMDGDPRLGAVQPRLLYPDGRLKDAGGLVFRDGELAACGEGSPFPDADVYSQRREPDYASGSCLLVRREAFDDVGGFDAHYASDTYEAVDLSFRLQDAGWRLLYEPAAVVVQVEPAEDDAETGLAALRAQDRRRFASRWVDALAGHPPLERAAPDETSSPS